MRLSQDRLVLAATVVAESAWVYAALGVVAAAMDREGSPLAWLGVLTVLAVSVVAGRMAPSRLETLEMVSLFRMVLGATVIYLTVGFHLAGESGGIDLGWLPGVISGSAPGGDTFVAVADTFVGVVLWWRGARLAAAEVPTDSLLFSFKLGVPVLAVATTVDIAHRASLNTFPMIFLFFASGLAGLSIGHLLPQTQQAAEAGTWPRVIAGIVAVITIVGLFFGLLHGGLLAYIAGQALASLDFAVSTLLWAIVIPISFVYSLLMNGLIDLLQGLFGDLAEPELARSAGGGLATSTGRGLRDLEADGSTPFFIQVVYWTTLAFLVIGILYILARAFQILPKGGGQEHKGRRESVSDEANVPSDVLRLLWNLLPDWLRSGERKPTFSVPDGPPGVVDVMRLYYDLLTLADKRGLRRRSHETATEFQQKLESVFPRDLVRMTTEAFNRAFYGHHPASGEQIERMRSYMNGLATGEV